MGWIGVWFNFFVQRRPLALRSLLRWKNELGVGPRLLLFSRAAEVREIFGRSRDFQVGYTIAPRSKLGPFLLTMDEGPRYEREKRALKRAVELAEPTLVAAAARESEGLARELAASSSHAARVDICSDYAERVFVRALAECFGLVPLDTWRSKHLDVERGERALALFVRTFGGTLGSVAPATFGLEQLADRLAPEFKSQLKELILQRRAELVRGSAPRATVIDWILAPRAAEDDPNRAQIEADAWFVRRGGLARSIGGLLAASASFPKVFAGLLYELARHKQLEFLVQQARGLSTDAWKVLVMPYVLEALRFRPPFPALVRYCPRATSVAGTAVPAGSTLGFSPLAAMFDPALVERPEVFVAGRPEDVYCIFGRGPRVCLGQNLMMGLLPPMLQALFVHMPQIAGMTSGEYRYDGPALDRFWVELPARDSVTQPGDSRTEGAVAWHAPPPSAPLAAAQGVCPMHHQPASPVLAASDKHARHVSVSGVHPTLAAAPDRAAHRSSVPMVSTGTVAAAPDRAAHRSSVPMVSTGTVAAAPDSAAHRSSVPMVSTGTVAAAPDSAAHRSSVPMVSTGTGPVRDAQLSRVRGQPQPAHPGDAFAGARTGVEHAGRPVAQVGHASPRAQQLAAAAAVAPDRVGRRSSAPPPPNMDGGQS